MQVFPGPSGINCPAPSKTICYQNVPPNRCEHCNFFPVTQKTLENLADNLNTPFLEIISTTTESLLKNIEVNSPNKLDIPQ
jgi:hypothetical protein